MKTLRDQLAKAFPDHIDAIVRNTKRDILDSDPEKNAADALISVFVWYESPEGHEFWSNLHKSVS